ncbi:MAG: LysR family transcriptional regulator [Curvibacter sp.]|nr:LysR family transcriptional regulator [Curvibacter sp.]
MLRRNQLPAIPSLLAFEAAARHGSISRAAGELHLTQGAVSRQIHQLEEQLGVALFHRVRQRVVLTDPGRIYAGELRPLLRQLSETTQRAMSFAGTGGVLHLAVLPTFGTRWLAPRLSRFAALHPEAGLSFATRTEAFDFDSQPFDAALHYGMPHWAGAECSYLMHEEVVPLCSPAYAGQQALRQPQDLARAVLLQQSTRPDLWADWFEQAGCRVAQPRRGPRFEQFSMIAEAAVHGLGAALLPRFLVEEEIAAARLQRLPGPALRQQEAYYLVVPESRAENPLVQAFKAWLVAECQAPAAASAPAG